MSEKQKVITVTLMREDLYDSQDYAGAYLNPPASKNEIQDAMEQARITGGQLYKIVECYSNQGEYLDFILENPQFNELNFLALRLTQMENRGITAFKGLAQMRKEPPTMQELINITYNM